MLRPALSPRALPAGAGVVLAAVLAFVIWEAVTHATHLLDVSVAYGVTVDAPAIDATSPTGHADGRRSLILPAGAADSAHWVMQTQEMIARGDWRIREVAYDNAPTGREVHWSSPPHWWLALLGWVDHATSGRPLGIALERATLSFGPVMLVIFLAVLVPIVSRRFTLTAAAAVALACVAAYPFRIDFLPGRADHHGIANIAAAGMLLCLVLGALPRDTSASSTRRWFVASGVAGGVGLWISAATIVPVLCGIGLGFLVAFWCTRSPTVSPAWLREPGVFRLWAVTGSLVSLAAYLLEYFPAHVGLRLEVNHPLYALAWAGAGEVFRAIAMARAALPGHPANHIKRAAAIGALGVACLPLTLLIAGAESFAVADPLIFQVHALYIAEFQGLLRHFATHGVTWGWLGICLPMLLLIPAWRTALRDPAADSRAALLLATTCATVAWLLGWWQVRWLGLAHALTMPVIALLVYRVVGRVPATKSGLLRIGLASLVFVPGLVDAVRRTLESRDFSPADVRSLAERDIAHWLRLRAAGERVVVASAPTTTTRLVAYGGLAGLGTLYWENAAGFKNASALFAAASAAAAHEQVSRLGVTHFVTVSWDAFELAQAKLYRGLRADAPIPADLFVARLLGAQVPPSWLRLLPFKLPANSALEDQQVRIWEVVPEQTALQSVVAMAGYHLEMGDLTRARQLEPLLAPFSGDLPANVMLAAITARARDSAAFGAAMSRVVAQISFADRLSLSDHIHLVVVLAVAQEVARAREQCDKAVAKISEAELRRLTAGTLADLIALTDALGVPFPNPSLAALARSLVPPSRRR